MTRIREEEFRQQQQWQQQQQPFNAPDKVGELAPELSETLS